MKTILLKFKELSLREKIGASIASILTVALTITIPVAAWFTKQRKLADLQYVNSPTKLYITAGHGEEAKYIDLSNVQVTATTDNAKYYVFAVTGSNAAYYNIQFAYTTNNQFEYFLYPAQEHEGNAPANTAMPYVSYTAHNDTGTDRNFYYTIDTSVINNSNSSDVSGYKISTGTIITRQETSSTITSLFLNQEGTLIKADKANTLHGDTYGENFNTAQVQDCAEPLYWQVRNIKSGMNPTTRELKDYYILEVNWEKTKAEFARQDIPFTDNGETDVIYISVASGTSGA